MVDETNVALQVTQIITDQCVVDADIVVPGAKLAEDLGADSLDGVEIIMSIEEMFAVTIADEECESVHTVQDWIDLTVRKIAEKQG